MITWEIFSVSFNYIRIDSINDLIYFIFDVCIFLQLPFNIFFESIFLNICPRMVCVMITIIVLSMWCDLMEGVAFKCIQISGRKTTKKERKKLTEQKIEIVMGWCFYSFIRSSNMFNINNVFSIHCWADGWHEGINIFF